MLHHLGVQALLPDAVGGAEFLAVAVVALAHILHPAVAVPVPDHRHKGLTAVAAGEQTGIPVCRSVLNGGSGILLQQRLCF